MSQVSPLQGAVGSTRTSEIATGHVMLSGRVERNTRKQGKDGPFFLVLLRQPAPDEYSSPSTVEVISPREVGRKGDQVTIECRVFGYPRTYTTKPSRDYPEGELMSTADNRLEVV